jgi:hypothetical protein
MPVSHARMTPSADSACELDGNALAEEIVHGITTLDAARGTLAVLAASTRGRRGIESVHRIRDTAYAQDANTGYPGNGPLRSWQPVHIAISLLHLAGTSEQATPAIRLLVSEMPAPAGRHD